VPPIPSQTQQPQTQQPQTQQTQQPQTQSGGGGLNSTALLQQLLSSPQLTTSLAQGIVGGITGAREIALEIAGPEDTTETVKIPLGAVMNTISHLAGEAMLELNAITHESEPQVPEYLMGESGEFIVDPGNPAARAALVLDYFRRAQALQQRRPTDDDFFNF
jgi:hypothetical protein